MNTKVWGSCGWLFLHSVALNYPVNPTYNDKVHMKTYFEMVGKVLPCNTCKKHYEDNLKKLPIQLNSRKDLLNWTIDFHNLVNEIIGKKKISRKEALDKIMCLYDSKKSCNNSVVIYLVTLILLFIGVKMIK